MAQGCERGEDGQLHPVLNINVNDPVAKISMSWQRGGMMPKVVHVFHQQAIVRPQMTPEEQAHALADLAVGHIECARIAFRRRGQRPRPSGSG